MTIRETLVARELRRYCNEVMDIDELVREEEMTLNESERALIQLDEKYAYVICAKLAQ